MKKSRLDRVIERNDEKKAVNYSVMDRANERLRQHESGQKKEKCFQWGALSKILVPLCCVVIILVGVVVFHHSSSDDPYIPPTFEQPDDVNKVYGIANAKQRFIQSISDYNNERKLSLKYFKLFDIEEEIIVYEDEENKKDKDVLLRQKVTLLETYESIEEFIILQGNYIFDFLEDYNSLQQKTEIKGISVQYNTFFDEEQYLYCTRTSLEIDGFTYKIEFLLENEEQWITYLSQIL